MALLISSFWRDVNGEEVELGFWVADLAGAQTALEHIDAVSNAKLIRADVSTPVPLQTIINNDAAAANVETARCKAKIKMRGADTGSLAAPFDEATVSIPAPIGTLINGKSGDPTNADVVGLVSHVLSDSGVQMTSVKSITYSRGR